MIMFNKAVLCTLGKVVFMLCVERNYLSFEGRREVNLNIQQCALLFQTMTCHWMVRAETWSLLCGAASGY